MTMAVRRCLNLLRLLSGAFLICPEGSMSLELLPSTSEVLLDSNASYTVVCSGWSQVKWRLPDDSQTNGVTVQTRGSSGVLQLINATWRNSGRYTCEEPSSEQSRDVDVFIPGRGPEEWFVPVGPSVVMKETEEDTIPCVVSDPRLNVSLHERGGQTAVSGMTYEPGRGFTGRLNDTAYVCIAVRGHEQKMSQVYYVFSVVVPKVMEVDLWVSNSVLKTGDVLTVNCTVRDTEMVFFTWDFPRRQDIEPLTEFLPNQIRSFVNISAVTAADSGMYACAVQETTEGRTVRKNVTVTVLDRGYVYLWLSSEANVSSILHHTVEFSVEVDAYPPPSILWTKDNQTVTMETTFKRLTGSRFVSTLTLVRVQMDQTGSYTATASNEDDADQVVFYLEVKAPPRITSLSEIGSNSVLCVSEGAPPPSVTWYICHSSDRCSVTSDDWRSLSGSMEGGTLQSNVSASGGVTQVRSVLSLKALASVSAVRCEARNSAGGRARDLRVLSSSLLSQVTVLIVVLVLVVLAVAFLIILIILWRKKPRYEVRWKVIESVSADGQQYTYLDPAHFPYNATWEVQRDRVALGPVLGSGTFGRVVQATVSGLSPSGSTTKVAVKMVKQRSDAAQSLMSELKLLDRLGPHLNIVNLLGACTAEGPVYLITEFCCHGNLVNYLQGHKPTFQGENHSGSDGGYMDMSKAESVQYVAMQELSHADIEAVVCEAADSCADQQQEAPLLLSDSSALSLRDLLGFSFQISQAMNYLSSRKCVHTDLAARNVLVCEGKLVKVADFGLARDLRKDQDYVARGNSFLPLKWMSPESIFQNIYSSQSDVWSYGVLLWELFSLGCSPYSELPTTQDFCSALKKGHRLSRPQHAPPRIYELMSKCWEDAPQSRPSFSSLVVSVGNLLSDNYKQRYLKLSEEFLRGNNPAVVRSRLASSKDAGGPAPQIAVELEEVEPAKAGPSQGTYVIPATDVTIETRRDAALDAASSQLADPSDDPPAAPPVDEEENGL